MPEGQELDLPALWMLGISGALFWTSVALWIVWLFKRQSKTCDASHRPLRPWAIGWINFGIFICGIICILVLLQVVLGVIAGPLLPQSSEEPGAWSMALGALTMQSSFLLAYWVGRKRYPLLFRGNLNGHSLHLLKALWIALPRFIRYVLLIGLVTYAWMEALELLIRLELISEFAPQDAVLIFGAGENPIALTALALLAIVLAPIAEEVIFRGCIYRFLKSEMPTTLAMLVSGAFFAVVHGNLMAFVPLMVVGFLLAYIYEKERSILVPICFHAYFNLLTLSMTTLRSLSAVEFTY